jgi:hypothetical protein
VIFAEKGFFVVVIKFTDMQTIILESKKAGNFAYRPFGFFVWGRVWGKTFLTQKFRGYILDVTPCFY